MRIEKGNNNYNNGAIVPLCQAATMVRLIHLSMMSLHIACIYENNWYMYLGKVLNIDEFDEVTFVEKCIYRFLIFYYINGAKYNTPRLMIFTLPKKYEQNIRYPRFQLIENMSY